MVLDKYRSTSDRYLSRFAQPFMKYNPNTLTAISMIFAVISGVLYAIATERYPYTLFLVPFALFANAVLDIIDGYVARKTNRATARGDFLDHVIDRYADIAILLGITLSPFCNDFIGMLAIVSVLLVSYMGTQAQAVGIKRIYGGLTSRADRLAIIMILAWVQFALIYTNYTLPEVFGIEYYITDFVMMWFIFAGNLSAIYRGIITWRELKLKEVDGGRRVK